MAHKSWLRRGTTSDKTPASRKLRNVGMVIALATLSTGGAVIASQSANSAPAPHQKVTICHRTNSNTNPYVEESPNINSEGLHGGHIDHTGPIWDPTLKAQHIKWGDIIPAFDYTNSSNVTVHFPGLNNGPDGLQILANGCDIPTTVVPGAPSVTQSVCAGDPSAATVPTVTFPTTTGVTYSISPAPVAGGSSVVTATATAPAFWFSDPAPAPWTFVDLTHETLTVNFDAAPDCSVPTTAIPTNPLVDQSTCVNGTPSVPTVALPETVGVTYSITPDPAAGGSSTVTATAQAPYQFVSPAPAGWVFVDSTHETFAIDFDAAPDCTLPLTDVQPVSPAVVDSMCAGDPSVATVPTLTLATTDGIVYTTSANAPYTGGQSVTVTATVGAPDDFVAPAPDGWTFVDSTHETFAITFGATPDCSAGAGQVAETGVASKTMMLIGGVALVLGLGLQFMGSRRRRTA